MSLACLTVLYVISALHDPLWFDEAYVMALMQQDIPSFFQSAIQDVHPVFYPILAKGALFLSGISPVQSPEGAILFLRLFSTLPIILMSVFGFTCVRKQWGELCGLFFSLFIGLAPSSYYYGLQIRMYSWVAFFVLAAFLQAYRCFKENADRKNFAFLALWSLLASYTHYYGLAAVFFLQIGLFFLLWRMRPKKRKIWFISCLSQVLFFLPGLFLFFIQSSAVAKGYWITMDYSQIFQESAIFFFQGSLSETKALFVAFLFAAVLIFILVKARNCFQQSDRAALWLCIFPLFAVWIFGLLASLYRPVFIPRYLFPMAGLFWLVPALILSSPLSKKEALDTAFKKGGTVLFYLVFFAVFLLAGFQNAMIRSRDLASEENPGWKSVIGKEWEEGDRFFFSDLNVGCQPYLYLPDSEFFFYNQFQWDSKNGLAGFDRLNFLDNPETLADCLKSGERIWIVDSDKTDLSALLPEEFVCIMPKQPCFHPYSVSWLNISLWQRI